MNENTEVPQPAPVVMLEPLAEIMGVSMGDVVERAVISLAFAWLPRILHAYVVEHDVIQFSQDWMADALAKEGWMFNGPDVRDAALVRGWIVRCGVITVTSNETGAIQ